MSVCEDILGKTVGRTRVIEEPAYIPFLFGI